jgi:hypothetical protein
MQIEKDLYEFEIGINKHKLEDYLSKDTITDLAQYLTELGYKKQANESNKTYINAKKLKKEITTSKDKIYYFAKDVLETLETFPTEDVVPRSEVEKADKEIERLTKILENYALQYGTVKDRQKIIEKAKQEVASEIFEELECNFHEDDFGDLKIDFMEFQELKKKYIGE